MAISRKYFHDHLILLLLSIQAFLAIAGSIYVVLRLNGSHISSYITRCRDCSNLANINRFDHGSIIELFAFVAFALIVLGIHTTLSMRAYHVQRQLSLAILSLGILLLVLNIIVSNALLVFS